MVIGRANATDNSCIFIVGNGTSIPSNIPNYNATSTYAVDDLVTYQHIVYKWKTAISAPEQFTSSHWNEQNIEVIDGQEITSRSNALTLNRNGNLTVSGSITANGVVLTNANPNISDAYDNTATYAVGDYCIYNNSLYKCSTAATVAEDFDSTKWTVTTIGAELLSIISRVSTLETALNGYSLADN